MGNRVIFSIAFQFLLYIVLQLVFFRNVALFQTAFCYMYVGVVLLLPFEIDRIPQLLLGFLLGLSVDIFYDTLGMHTFATVGLVYARLLILNYLQPTTGYEMGGKPFLRDMGMTWFVTYTLPLLFIHHALVFIIEISDFSLFPRIVTQTIGSTFFTFLVLLIGQIIFYPKRRRR